MSATVTATTSRKLGHDRRKPLLEVCIYSLKNTFGFSEKSTNTDIR